MADVIWERMFRGEHVSISFDDLTNHRLREMKGTFGPDYGIPTKFNYLLLMFDCDAVTCALWINGQKNGKPIGNILEFDWNVADFEMVPETPKPKPSPKEKPATSASTGSE